MQKIRPPEISEPFWKLYLQKQRRERHIVLFWGFLWSSKGWHPRMHVRPRVRACLGIRMFAHVRVHASVPLAPAGLEGGWVDQPGNGHGDVRIERPEHYFENPPAPACRGNRLDQVSPPPSVSPPRGPKTIKPHPPPSPLFVPGGWPRSPSPQNR